MSTKKDPCRVVITKARSSFMFLTKLEEDDKGNKKCRTQIIIPKKNKALVAKIEKAIESASQKKFSKKAVKNSSKFGYPLRDADKEIKSGEYETEHPEAYKNCYFMNAAAYKLPGLVDSDNEIVDDPDEKSEMLTSGYYFNFSVTFKGYDNESKGIRAELNNVMFVKEGERLDGGVAADSEDWDGDGSDQDDDSGSSDTEYTPDKIKELCAELVEAADKDTLSEVLDEFDVSNARKAAKLDDDERSELGEALEEAIDEAD